MASNKRPSMYSNDELEAYGVWVKSEPQDFTASLETASFNVDALPYEADFDSEFDDMGTGTAGFDMLESELHIPEIGLEDDDIMTSAEPGSDEASTQMLMKIAGELSSIRSELNTLKREFAEIRGEGSPDPFSGEDDEKIALSGDEMESFFSAADFPAGEDADFDSRREADEAALKELEAQNETEEIHIDFDNLGIDLDSITEEPQDELPPLEAIDDDDFAIPSFDDTLSFEETPEPDELEEVSGFAEELVPLEGEDEELQALRLEGAEPLSSPPDNADYLEEDPFALSKADGLELESSSLVEETTLEETAFQEPALEEITLEEPVFEEPVLEETAFQETAFQETGIEETTLEEPVLEEEPALEEITLEETTLEESALEEPVLEEITLEEPVFEEPALEEITLEETTLEETTLEEPALEEPVLEEEPALEEITLEEATLDETAFEEAALEEEPALEELTLEEATLEETTLEETALEEPVLEEEPALEAAADTAFDAVSFDETSFDIGLDDLPAEPAPIEEAVEETIEESAEPLPDIDALDLSEAVIDEPNLAEEIVEPPLEEPVLGDISFGDDIALEMDDFGAETAAEAQADEPAAEAEDAQADALGAADFDLGTIELDAQADDLGTVDIGEDIVLDTQLDDLSTVDFGEELEPAAELEPEIEEAAQPAAKPAPVNDIISDVDDSLIPEGLEVNAKEADPSLDDDLEAIAGDLAITGDEFPSDSDDQLADDDSGEFSSISPALKTELKNVLSYMDHLLESLPEDKIEEFAQSEYFDKYKKIFKELGLV